MGEQKYPFTIAVDFDATIHRYSKGWHDGTIYDPPMEGAKEGMQALKDEGCKLVIFTTRAMDRFIGGVLEPGQKADVEAWLKKYEIPFDEIYNHPGKPLAHQYLDDRGVRFYSWAQSVRDLKALKADPKAIVPVARYEAVLRCGAVRPITEKDAFLIEANRLHEINLFREFHHPELLIRAYLFELYRDGSGVRFVDGKTYKVTIEEVAERSHPMAKVADVRLSWKKSVTPLVEIDKVQIIVVMDGNTTVTDLGPPVEEFMIEVHPLQAVQFKISTFDKEGLEATSETYLFTLGDLEAPQPATQLKHEVVAIRDVEVPPPPPPPAPTPPAPTPVSAAKSKETK